MKLILFATIWGALYFVGKYLFGAKGGFESGKNKKVLAGSLIITLIIHFYIIPYHGTKNPGSIFERSEYKAEFYVNLFPSRMRTKNYRVPAMIHSTVEYEEFPDGSTDSWRAYWLRYVRFPNGGKVSFLNSDDPLELNKKVLVFDDSGREWYVELTDKRYENSK